MMDTKNIAVNLRRLKEASEVSYEQFALKSGVSSSYLKALVKGTSIPRPDKIVKIANSLRVGTDEILNDGTISRELKLNEYTNEMVDLSAKQITRISNMVYDLIADKN